MTKRMFLALLGMGSLVNIVTPESALSHNPVTTTVLFNREVIRVLNDKCAPCHAPGGMATPFRTYDETRPWAIAIKEEVLTKHMPPWAAEPGYGQFLNDPSLTLREQAFLVSWIDGGVPPGEGPTPNYVDHSSHWMLGEPYRVYSAVASASTRAGFRRFIVSTNLPTETLLRAIDLKPNDSYARAAFLTVLSTGQYIGGWTRSFPRIEFPEHTAVRLPRNARIAIDVLYGPASPKTADPPRVGLYRAAGQEQSVRTALIRAPGGSDVSKVQRAFTEARTVFALRADGSRNVQSFEVRAKTPDGAYIPLVLVRSFDPDWQTPFILRHPVTLAPGSTIEAMIHFHRQPVADDFALNVLWHQPLSTPTQTAR